MQLTAELTVVPNYAMGSSACMQLVLLLCSVRTHMIGIIFTYPRSDCLLHVIACSGA